MNVIKSIISTVSGLFLGLVCLFVGFIVCGFVMFAMMPTPPAQLNLIDFSNDSLLTDSYISLNANKWAVNNKELHFINKSAKKEKATVFTNELPSENLKKGYVTSSVVLKTDLENIAEDAIIGFELGERNSKDSEKLLFGINGSGKVVYLDGNRASLKNEKIKVFQEEKEICDGEVKLSFHYYENPTGWVLFFRLKSLTDPECTIGATINNIPFDKLNDPTKQLSLSIYNPSSKGEISFSDWQIQPDWTPND